MIQQLQDLSGRQVVAAHEQEGALVLRLDDGQYLTTDHAWSIDPVQGIDGLVGKVLCGAEEEQPQGFYPRLPIVHLKMTEDIEIAIQLRNLGSFGICSGNTPLLERFS